MRFFFDIIFFISIMLFPWWLSFSFGVALSFYFKNFYELVFAGIIFDLLFGAGNAQNITFQYIFSVSTIVLVLLIEFVKKKLWYYS